MTAIIAFDASFTDVERRILQKTFRRNCLDLGIDKRDFTVHVRKFKSDNLHCFGRVANPAPEFFAVELDSEKFNMFDATSALGHECVHIKQHLFDQLYDTEHGAVWQGQLFTDEFCNDRVNYKNLPWEQEAFGLQVALHINAICSLNKEEKQLCHIKHSKGLADLWLLSFKDYLEKKAA